MTGAAVQAGFALWLVGLPASGKSSLAQALAGRLADQQIHTQILDSDELRDWLTPDPTYSPQERDWFYRTVAHIAELLTKNGVNVLIAATAPLERHRHFARQRIERLAVVHVDCPPEVCRKRDPKGLWQRAARGEIETLPGAGFPFEAPQKPEVAVDTHALTPEEAAVDVVEALTKQGFFQYRV